MTSNQTFLLTGGRAPVTLELARLAHAAGMRVIVAESLALPLTRFSRAVHAHHRVPSPRMAPVAFVSALSDIVRRERVDLLIPTCEEVFHLARHGDALRSLTQLFAAPFDALLALHSKLRFIALVQAAGLPAPHTARFTDRDALRAHVRSGEPMVLKPEFSRFATRVLVRPRPSDVDLLDVSVASPWVAQQRVHGTPICSYAVCHAGKVRAHAAYDVVHTAGLASTIHFRARRDARVRDWVTRFVAHLGFSGQIAFDFILDADGVLLPLECNPRATSGVHLFRSQPGFARAFVDPQGPMLEPTDDRSMLAVPMLVYGLPRAFREGTLRAFAGTFAESRDVVFRRDDPWPALAQGLSLLELGALAFRSGRDLLGASTLDIEFNGEHA